MESLREAAECVGPCFLGRWLTCCHCISLCEDDVETKSSFFGIDEGAIYSELSCLHGLDGSMMYCKWGSYIFWVNWG